ncbi:MAG: SGNH/GDSL hydrolase family protein [Mariniphaga sp.]
MKKFKFIVALLLLSVLTVQFSFAQDWPNLERFRAENANQVLPTPNEKRVVFMGNSITEGWVNLHPQFFTGKFYLNRGISGQTTPQMLLRFRADVIKMKPRVVVILAGTNDIAGNTGPSTLEMIEDNIISMAQLAKANDIKVILCSVLPVYDYPWKPGLEPAGKIINLNKMIKAYADKSGCIYLDFFSAMVDERNGLKSEYSKDGVHPNDAGYNVMEPLTELAIEKAFGNIPPVHHPKSGKPVSHKKKHK